MQEGHSEAEAGGKGHAGGVGGSAELEDGSETQHGCSDQIPELLTHPSSRAARPPVRSAFSLVHFHASVLIPTLTKPTALTTTASLSST